MSVSSRSSSIGFMEIIEREITKNSIEKIINPKVHCKIKPTLAEEEIKRVLDQFDMSKFHAFRNWIVTRLLLDTGMRIGECLSLLPENVDLPHKSILAVTTKNKEQRYVYFSSKMAQDIKSWLRYRDRYNDSPFLFPTTTGTQLEIRNFEKALRDAGKRARVEIHPHQLRNNFAKYYILNGGDWFTLSRILGHSSVEVTQKAYLDFTDNEISKKYQRHSPLMGMDKL
ncbi:site-specific integrase [Paenibacillus pasadenensis]|uniref:tyrosine-type recombinase/integrase n=1 Tax=Paenibacillus pasadenensis TaxID=217090 RepID=UPI00203AF1D1|nr:site-specific integrase [Paenibacillus pasadenensis]MCM3747315.1 site-specific integrase [Paenibacillus pasadenensis]